MNVPLFFFPRGALVALAVAFPVLAWADESAPSFEKDIAPIFQESCADCHSSDESMSELNLDSAKSTFKGGELSGASVIPGNSGKSPLLQYLRGEKEPRMPKDEEPLPEDQIALIAKWVDGLGKSADVPGETGPKRHGWPWTQLERPEVPNVKRGDWVKTPIDAFVLAKLEEKGLQPAPPATKRAMLRRLSFGLIGLPPTPEEMDRFLDDSSPEAYDEQIETALADKGYGERWGRHWLDLVRYSDTRGGAIDYARPHMWRYRDYVIRAFNQDRPYDRFIREQLAGDAMGAYGDEGKIALAYLGQWVQVERDSGEQIRRDFLTDVVDTTGSVFLGLTLGCARCHDHKFDPIPTRDYYRMEAFFAPLSVNVASIPFSQYELPKGQPDLWDKKAKAWAAELDRRKEFQDKTLAKFKERLEDHRHLAAGADLKDLIVPVSDGDLKLAMREGILFNKQEQDLYELIGRQTARFANPNHRDYYEPKAHTVSDSPLHFSVATHILSGGNYKLKEAAVEPGLLSAATGDSEPVNLEGLTGSRRKLLAQWIASEKNPLTARVMVNRIWKYHFGTGLVLTPSDFGANGGGTVHRELLDWLAWRFIENGWSIKDVHRLILKSNVYRQSMRHPHSTECDKIDPENRYFWVREPIRLEAEVIRDNVLAVSGQLQRQMGGPPFFPEADDELLKRAPTWWAPSAVEERSRRTIYMLQIRSFQLPFIRVFDGPNMDDTCPVRNMTTVTPQVFSLFNSKFAHDQSRQMAERIDGEAGGDPRRQVERAFRLAFQRAPSPSERASCVAFLSRGVHAAEPTVAAASETAAAGPATSSEKVQDAQGPSGSLADLCLILINANEFIFLE